MNDLFFIKYEPKLMFLDTLDMSCETEQAHRRLADYIWISDSVPKAETDSLLRITKTKQSDWPNVFAELKARGWFERGGFLIHKGIVNALNESKSAYATQFNKTAKANKLKPLCVSEPNDVTGIVTLTVTQGVTSHVTLAVTQSVTDAVTPDKSQSQLQSDIAEREKEPEFPQVPPISRKDFDALVELRGVPADCAEWFWNVHDARNWLDRSGQPIRKVEPLLLNAAAKWRQKQYQDTTTSNSNQPSKPASGSAEMILRTNELKRVEERMRDIRMQYESHQTMNDKDRAEMAQLKARRGELMKTLGFKV